jgi:hypothetical protein
MWRALAEPQRGVLKMFKAGNIPQIRATTFWASLRSLDVAMSIKRIKNELLVSAEQVKLLAVNTGIKTIDYLQGKFNSWKVSWVTHTKKLLLQQMQSSCLVTSRIRQREHLMRSRSKTKGNRACKGKWRVPTVTHNSP